MKVFYHSAFTHRELAAGEVFRTIPCGAVLEWTLERGEMGQECSVLFNGGAVNPEQRQVDCTGQAELIIRLRGERYVYLVRPLAAPLSGQYARTYRRFFYEYSRRRGGEIERIQSGALKLYAVDQSVTVHDWTETFERVEAAFSAFRAICEKPKSHLKAINEVRPIETVKRIGYESIPYLAAHSEDWLARTAGGLKPARLFSRVEDDEYQIYENRVVKTLIDQILSLLRKIERELRDQYEQLHGIMNSGVQTGSFGFDVSFQKALSELLNSDEKSDEYRLEAMELADSFRRRAALLIKKYSALRQSRLYRCLRRSKAASNPLNETNILMMDKHYNVVFKLWKVIHRELAPPMAEEEAKPEFAAVCSGYLAFCKTLCGYAAHTLNFDEMGEGVYYRPADGLEIRIQEESGRVRVAVRDKTPRCLTLAGGLQLPVAAGSRFGPFRFDGAALFWDSDTTDDDIEAFCSLFKTRESRGKEQAEEKRRYQALRMAIDRRQREYPVPRRSTFTIVPAAVELSGHNRGAFRSYVEERVQSEGDDGASCVIAALPKCDENEQEVTAYARMANERLLILPLTMFDINSFRRIQNVLLRQIVSMGRETCPCCGGGMRESAGGLVCDTCNQLRLARTVCPNPACKHEYAYLSFDTPPDTISRMRGVEQANFYQWDSLYQYKDIVGMSVASGKLRTVCPCCGRE